MKIFPIVKKVTVVGGGASGLTDAFSLHLTAPETSPAPADAASFALALGVSETVPGQLEAVQLRFPAGSFGDALASPADVRALQVASWATGCSDNDSSQTTPANANGQADGTAATVKTNNSLGDLTNPVILTSGSMNWPGALSGAGPVVDLYFSVGSRAAALDTVVLTYDDGAGHSGTLWTWGTGAESYPLTAPLPVALHPATVLSSLVLRCSYTATVVAAPQGAVALDGWRLRAATTL